MKRLKFNLVISLAAWNGIFAFALLLIIKLSRNRFSIDNFIYWMQEDTKKMAIIPCHPLSHAVFHDIKYN